ncbi:MAG: hypothetical protein JWR53_1349 [Glaciihabitans sp.]|nr:hypothetical protein [Glaciihabitans sp.]
MSEPRRTPLVYAVVVLLFAESLLLAASAIYLAVELVITTPAFPMSAIALAVFAALGAAGLAIVASAAWRGRAWSRGASITWQVLQGAVAISALTGKGAQAGFGVPLLLLAVVVLVLVFTPPVLRWVSKRG